MKSKVKLFYTIWEQYFQHIEQLHRDHDCHDHVQIHRLDKVQDDEVLQRLRHLRKEFFQYRKKIYF